MASVGEFVLQIIQIYKKKKKKFFRGWGWGGGGGLS